MVKIVCSSVCPLSYMGTGADPAVSQKGGFNLLKMLPRGGPTSIFRQFPRHFKKIYLGTQKKKEEIYQNSGFKGGGCHFYKFYLS